MPSFRLIRKATACKALPYGVTVAIASIQLSRAHSDSSIDESAHTLASDVVAVSKRYSLYHGSAQLLVPDGTKLLQAPTSNAMR